MEVIILQQQKLKGIDILACDGLVSLKQIYTFPTKASSVMWDSEAPGYSVER